MESLSKRFEKALDIFNGLEGKKRKREDDVKNVFVIVQDGIMQNSFQFELGLGKVFLISQDLAADFQVDLKGRCFIQVKKNEGVLIQNVLNNDETEDLKVNGEKLIIQPGDSFSLKKLIRFSDFKSTNVSFGDKKMTFELK
jgi:hypothetical protein